MKNSKKNKWADHYTQKAREHGFPARSVYKLDEIQNKYRLIKKGDNVLDLGCAPGSWLMYAADIVGKSGQIKGIDLNPVSVKLPGNVTTYVGNIQDMNQEIAQSVGRGFNVVLSDMAPATTGNKFSDSVKSFDLARSAINIAIEVLAAGGCFVCKIFQGEDFKEFSDYAGKFFYKNRILKPKSSRKASREIFIISSNKKGRDQGS